MIQTKKGNLLNAHGLIVHGVNCQGVMGSGVAAQIRSKWPTVYERYKLDEEKIGLQLGDVQIVAVESGQVVANAVTQEFYGRGGKVYVDYKAVRKCFREINKYAVLWNLTVNFPLIGCGLAGGKWDIVSKIIDEELDDSLEKVLWLM